MIRSLTIKFVLLAGTLGCILALNWAGLDRVVDTHQHKIEEAAKNISLSIERSITDDSSSKSFNKKTIDLNFSTAQELETLPGIGPILAKRIVDYRMKVGGFQSIQALDQVKGIGEKKLQALSPLLKIFPSIVAKKSQG